MLAKLKTFSLLGIDALPVEVEVDVSPAALPKTVLVGLPEAAVRESTHRVERAIVNSGFVRPRDRIVINLAPAELPKQAASFDLPMTLGILAGSSQIRLRHVRAVRGRRRAVAGGSNPADPRCSFDGDGRRPAARIAGPGRAYGQRGGSGRCGADLDVIAVDSLAQAVAFYTGQLSVDPTPSRLEDLFHEFCRVRRGLLGRPRTGNGQACAHDRCGRAA